jgi:hypothetical protein
LQAPRRSFADYASAMRLVVLTFAVLPLAGCAHDATCPIVGEQGFVEIEGRLRGSAGLVLTRSGAAEEASNDCDVTKSEPNLCAPSSVDDVCVACLKLACCMESAEWFNGASSAGADVVACVNEHCVNECPRAM